MIGIQNTADDTFQKYYGNYRALVVDDEDPRDIGRIKVRVLGVDREDAADEDLSWALPALGLYRSGGDNTKPEMSTDKTQNELATGFNTTGTGGIFTVPARGNHVFVFFDNGNHMNPFYFAMAPGENDYLTQKQFVKDKIDTKIKQIIKLREKFVPERGDTGFSGKDWADGAHENARQDVSSGGQKAPYEKGTGTSDATNNAGSTKIKGGKYVPRRLNIDNADQHGDSSKNMDNSENREWANSVLMDIKPLFDKESETIDREKEPHTYDKDGKMDDAKENGRNINRYITTTTTQGGPTTVIDNREGQENYYFIHKNYLENIDQDGSRKVFVGQNDPRETLVRHTDVNDERNKGPTAEIRSNDELLVAGDKKTHVLGNVVEYVKGNSFTQIDKNIQFDINDSCGIRIKKGDFDIIINGSKEISRDKNSDRENGKVEQFGDLTIDIQDGHMDIHVKKNANIHVEGQANIKVDGDMRTTVGKSYHLTVKGDYNEIIEGNKYQTVKGNNELKIGGYLAIDMPGQMSVKTSALVVSANIFSDKTSLNKYWKHVHGGVYPGSAYTSQWGFDNSAPTTIVGTKSIPGAGKESDKTSSNQTILAARNNANRGNKE